VQGRRAGASGREGRRQKHGQSESSDHQAPLSLDKRASRL
jgi:hypothetical protein